MKRQFVATTPHLVVGPFDSESQASAYIATRSSGADYRILELVAPKEMNEAGKGRQLTQLSTQ